MVVSSISLMAFLGLVAYDGWSVGVLVIGMLVVLVMILPLIVYGVHRFTTSALDVCRAITVLLDNVVHGFRSLSS